MRMIPANAQHVGARHEQQDAFGFTDIDQATFVAHGGVLAVVADGMGGLEMGGPSSRCAVHTILTTYAAKSPEVPISEVLARALQHANASVLRLADEAGYRGGVGTTVVAAVIHKGELHWVAVGDSRLYLYRQGELTQLTSDHSFAVELDRAVERGDLTQEEANRHPERRSLTSYVGIPVLHAIEASPTPLLLQSGDRILLCAAMVSMARLMNTRWPWPWMRARLKWRTSLSRGHWISSMRIRTI
ncbi:MAG: serine/threonine-protein phosphatase [Deltaproteobacteria bacterium]|nr:serine/threonine-protein phosphatase [Deltaproteobacteria bacterium]